MPPDSYTTSLFGCVNKKHTNRLSVGEEDRFSEGSAQRAREVLTSGREGVPCRMSPATFLPIMPSRDASSRTWRTMTTAAPGSSGCMNSPEESVTRLFPLQCVQGRLRTYHSRQRILELHTSSFQTPQRDQTKLIATAPPSAPVSLSEGNRVGAGLTPAPPTPPDMRARIRRFAEHP